MLSTYTVNDKMFFEKLKKMNPSYFKEHQDLTKNKKNSKKSKLLLDTFESKLRNYKMMMMYHFVNVKGFQEFEEGLFLKGLQNKVMEEESNNSNFKNIGTLNMDLKI